MRRKVSHMLLCAVIALLSGWAGHWLGSRKRSIVRVPETVVRHDTIRPAIPEPEVIVREVPTEVDTVVVDYRQPVVCNNALALGLEIGRSWQVLSAEYRHKQWEFRAGYDLYNRSLVLGISKTLWQW